MTAIRLKVLLLTLAAAAGACGGQAKPLDPAYSTGPLTLTSSAFAEGKLIPIAFTCAEAGVTPPMTWKGAAPPHTVEWAIVAEDTDVAPTPFIHWVTSGLKPATRRLARNESPPGSISSLASSGASGYVGPCPPPNHVHHYRFTVYALGHSPHLTAASPAKDAAAAIRAAAIGSATMTALFGR